jgi:Histidine kinase-, DNA gyrase B-, and HSP90-like ATPase
MLCGSIVGWTPAGVAMSTSQPALHTVAPLGSLTAGDLPYLERANLVQTRRDGRQQIRELNPAPICQVAEWADGAIEGKSRDLHPIVRDDIYKIAAEALRNAFRHADAAQVEVEIRYDDKEFRLRVRDDGKGIDPQVLASHGLEGHYGLRGMPERAALIGGNLAVLSKVGVGTEVELRLPGSVAYASSPKRRRWSRLFAATLTTPRNEDAS